MSQVTSKDGTEIAYERSGQGSAVILVDGAMGYRDHMGMKPLAAELAKNFTTIVFDRRGRGESGDTQPYAVEREIEDIEALIDEVGDSVYLYGFSSGSVLALKAAARLSGKVMKLALLEPPLNEDDAQSRQKFKERSDHMARLLEDGKNGDAVEFFLSDMLPPEVLEGMKQSPDWKVMEGVAPTLAYDNVVMGDGSVPTEAARAATMPTLVLDGGESPEFKHAVADALADAMPHAERKTLEGQITLVPSEILAPVLTEFFQ
jgi:pimeloyl-ACP methyl ester carboxylesterase